MKLYPPSLPYRDPLWVWHAITPLGGCCCDPDLPLNLAAPTEVYCVPPGLRCRRPECAAQIRAR
jgi:hypothetical protein